MTDLFEQNQGMPFVLREVCDKYMHDNLTYEDCKQFHKAVEEIGYAFEYVLDATPFHLRLITKTESIN